MCPKGGCREEWAQAMGRRKEIGDICLECGQARRIGDWLQVFILVRWQMTNEKRVTNFQQFSSTFKMRGVRKLWVCGKEKGLGMQQQVGKGGAVTEYSSHVPSMDDRLPFRCRIS